MKYLILLTLLLSPQLHADKLILGGVSHHFHNRYMDYNEVHPSIGIERGGVEFALTVNSLERPSLMLTKLVQPWAYSGLKFGYRYGAGTGYEEDVVESEKYCDGNICIDVEYTAAGYYSINGIQPILQAVVSKEFEHFTLDLGVSSVSTLIFKFNL